MAGTSGEQRQRPHGRAHMSVRFHSWDLFVSWNPKKCMNADVVSEVHMVDEQIVVCGCMQKKTNRPTHVFAEIPGIEIQDKRAKRFNAKKKRS